MEKNKAGKWGGSEGGSFLKFLFYFFCPIVWHVKLPRPEVPGVEPVPPVVEEWNLNRCTARKVQDFPFSLFIYYLNIFKKIYFWLHVGFLLLW